MDLKQFHKLRGTQEVVALAMPAVNLNGTSQRELLEGYLDAMDGVRKALETLRKTIPNGRDYQTLPDGVFRQAQKEHVDRAKRLDSVYKELEMIAESIA